MKYMGSKSKISKYILPFIHELLKNKDCYVEPFVGGANMIDKIIFDKKIGNDINKYLISMWQSLQNGWIPPEFITREEYSFYRDQYNKKLDEKNADYKMLGYVGFNGSYGGRFFDGGYAGITKTKDGMERNYPLEAFKNIYSQVKNISNINFTCFDYKTIEIPENSLIYCDIPYQGTKKYSTNSFDHEEFWNWCRSIGKKGHTILVSEYNAP